MTDITIPPEAVEAGREITRLRAENERLRAACEDAAEVVDALVLLDAHADDDVLSDLADTLHAALANPAPKQEKSND